MLTIFLCSSTYNVRIGGGYSVYVEELARHKKLVNLIQLVLSELAFEMLCIPLVFIIFNLKHLVAIQFGCGTSFERGVTYDGIVPNDENVDSMTGLDLFRCCMYCHHERPHCVGVLHNKVEMKCKLLKGSVNWTYEVGNRKNIKWEYFQKK
jgi:hypothetical protein